MGDQARQLMQYLDWSMLSETLRVRKLLPVLGPRILELAEGSTDDGFAGAVELAVETGRRQSALLQLVTLRVMAILGEAGIRSAPLKGPLLGEAIYGDPGRRLSNDIDLLVPPAQLRAAVEIVRGMGYDRPRDHVEHSGLPLLHFALVHAHGDLPPVELHWRIHWYEQSYAQERLMPPAVDPEHDWRPARVDELASLLLFYARDGFVDLRLATDLSAWWDAVGGELAPGAFDQLLRLYPSLARPLVVAIRVAERVVGLPAPQILEHEPELDPRGRIAVRLANPNPRSSQSQLYADIGLIDGLLAPRGGFGAFVRRQILPPRDVLDQHARHGARRRRRSYLGRGAGVLTRYGLTMARLARPRETLP
jgi:hypothetical protein